MPFGSNERDTPEEIEKILRCRKIILDELDSILSNIHSMSDNGDDLTMTIFGVSRFIVSQLHDLAIKHKSYDYPQVS